MSQALEIYKNHQFYQTWQSFRDEFNKGYIPEQIDDTDRLKYYDIINKNIEFIDSWLSLLIDDTELGKTNTYLNNANTDRKSTRLNSSHIATSRMPSSA